MNEACLSDESLKVNIKSGNLKLLDIIFRIAVSKNRSSALLKSLIS